MTPLSMIDFGPIDAATPDKAFLEKYVEENNFQPLLDNQYSLIAGEKGSGKTALIKGLTLKHADNFSKFVTINFDEEISFNPIVENLVAISRTTGIESLKLMTSYWQYTLIVEVMKQVIGERRTHFNIIETDIYNFLVKNKHIEEDLFSRLINISVRIWQMIERITHPFHNKIIHDAFPGSIPPDLLSEIRRFPLKTSYNKKVWKK